ncbi:MAG: enoyl-CoA hydratase/isomerase family protein [Hyphomicrobiales bacterium]|nr:enoyl-CoA hydratase/isomerase family protein [Hyphomicrobiales bacterium]MCP5372197.1 enoyl-CoA hydratase/isomerase family protein [Hyphomicrobiales bacterium]
MMASIPKLQCARLSLDDRVAVMTFARDDVRNALTGTGLVDDICAVVAWADAAEDVSVLVMTGEGKAFSAGGNIKDMASRAAAGGGRPAETESRYRAGIQRIPLALHKAQVPVIAAVNGPAIGAGCDLACMCDIRIASERAVFAQSFVNLGIVPGDGGAWFLQRLVGYQRAAELALTGRRLGAEEALELGLVMEVVDHDRLMDASLDRARAMAAKPPQALRYTKRLLKQAQRMDLPDFLDLCAAYQSICHATDDHREAVTALLENRNGRFKGA